MSSVSDFPASWWFFNKTAKKLQWRKQTVPRTVRYRADRSFARYPLRKMCLYCRGLFGDSKKYNARCFCDPACVLAYADLYSYSRLLAYVRIAVIRGIILPKD